MSRRQRHSSPDPVNLFFDSVFKVIGYLVRLPFRSKTKLAAIEQAKAKTRQHWSQIENYARNRQWREAIMNADILLDQALQFHNAPGSTTGERLKAAAKYLSGSTIDQAWEAHKVRNRLAHELNFVPSDSVARGALTNFKQVLQQFGVL